MGPGDCNLRLPRPSSAAGEKQRFRGASDRSRVLDARQPNAQPEMGTRSRDPNNSTIWIVGSQAPKKCNIEKEWFVNASNSSVLEFGTGESHVAPFMWVPDGEGHAATAAKSCCICIRIYIYIFVYKYVRAPVCMCACMHASMYECLCVCMHIYLRMCVYIFMCICIRCTQAYVNVYV